MHTTSSTMDGKRKPLRFNPIEMMPLAMTSAK